MLLRKCPMSRTCSSHSELRPPKAIGARQEAEPSIRMDRMFETWYRLVTVLLYSVCISAAAYILLT